jgi:hypothetical protein
MSIAFFDCLWQMHDETKALVLFRPLEIIRNSSKDNIFQQERDDAPSVERLEEAPAELSDSPQTDLFSALWLQLQPPLPFSQTPRPQL